MFAGLGVALSSKEAGVWPSSLGAGAHFAETGTSFSRLHKTCASSQACLFWVSWLSAEIRACVIRAGNSKETLGCSRGGSWELQSKAESGGPRSGWREGLCILLEQGLRASSCYFFLPMLSLTGPRRSAQCPPAGDSATGAFQVWVEKDLSFFHLNSRIPSAYTLLTLLCELSFVTSAVTSPRHYVFPTKGFGEHSGVNISGAKCLCSGCFRSTTNRDLYKGLPLTKHLA